jgi:hypothetical protein
MKQYLKGIILFMLPIFLIGGFLEYTTRQIPNDYSYKNHYLSKEAEDLEVLILGSSHTAYGVRPEVFSSKAFNAAHVGQSLKYDEFILEKTLKSAPQLKTIFLPISYFTLFSDEAERTRKNYAIYYNCPLYQEPHYQFELLNINRKTIKRLLKNTTNYWFGKSPSNQNVSELGYKTLHLDSPQADLEKTGQQAAKRHFAEDFKLKKENKKRLENIIAQCEEHSVQLILFTPPAWETYRKHLNKNQLDEMKRTIKNVLQKHNDISYYSFLEDERLLKEDFRDGDHLNTQGAEKFTKILKSHFKVE